MATYFFSRLSISMEPDYLKKLEYLYGLLVHSKSIIYRKDNYKVFNIEVKRVGSKSFITGAIIKYASEHSEKILNDENKIEDVFLRNHLLANVRFIIDSNESLFIFEESRSHIPKETLPDRFLTILATGVQNDRSPISITPITESYTFLNRIKEIIQIKKITIKLHPSNPNNRDRWKTVDDKLKNDNITDYKEVLENKTPGGSINVDEETTAKIMMGEDGYGKTIAEGIDEKGERISITTASSEVQAKADIESKVDIEEEIIELQTKTAEIKNKPDTDVN
jgi:hypothetical protein